MAATDSLVLRVYDQIGTGAVTQRAEFTSVQLGASKLAASTWTIYYYTVRTTGGAGANSYTGSTFYWGTTTYNSRVENFVMWKNDMSTLYDNTLNWTHSGADVDHYNIYRSSTQLGTYSVIGTSPVGTNTYCDIGKGLADATIWWYRVRAVDAATNEETNIVSVPEPSLGATATATGPTGGPTNVAAVTLLYSYIGTPTSVNLYYTKSTSSPYTWVLAGNDASVNGNYAYTITAGSGTYGWLASAVGGSSTEPSPPGTTVPPEAASYIFDNVAPTITATTFTDGATGVAVTAGQYNADFSENMAAVGSVTTNLPGAVVSWADANTYRITYNALADLTAYTLTYTGFTDVAGNALSGDAVKTFTTGDFTAPTITATTFTDGATGVSVAAGQYNADFSENMAAVGSVTTNLPGASGSWVDANTYRITYTALAESTAYTLTYTGFTDVASNALGGDTIKVFTTGDFTGPIITSTTFTDGAIDVALAAGQYDADFNENMAAIGSVTTNLPGASGSWVDANTYRVTYTALAPSTTYTMTYAGFTDAIGNPLVGDAAKEFTTLAGSTATATGPTGGPTNIANIAITYAWVGTPTTVNLYYTTNGGTTWTLAGNDASVDGSFSFTRPASGSYQFLASAVGGGSTEPSPPSGGTPPETALPYILDITPPAAPTDLTVEHWGPAGSGGTVTETLYMRGIVNEATVNGLTAYSLSTTQSANPQTYQIVAARQNVWAGIRVWSRTSGGVETEITSGTSAIAGPPGNNVQGMFVATWDCPGVALETTDSIVVRIYGGIASPPNTLAAEFTTDVLGATQLEAVQWTVNYYMGQLSGNSFVGWGDATYNTNIANFQYSTGTGGDPTDHNTLNWTASVSGDLDHYNIYRADSEFGMYSVIDTVPAGTNTYVDLGMGQADAVIWWYKVRAVDAVGNEEQNDIAVPEPSGPIPLAYSIDLTGKPAGWVLVSFPIEINGNIEAILNDSGTIWNVAKWYDPITKQWKTYRKTGTQSFTSIDNTMGVWLHLTANGDDQLLTTTLMGMMPTTEVAIQLYAGWNMVGYPSATSRLGSLTLPAEADLVAEWQLSSPYIIDKAKADVTMSEGNAYWVRVSTDCVWYVQP